jgi:beta-glucosidase
VGTHATLGRLGGAGIAAAIVLGAAVAMPSASARDDAEVSAATCAARPWVQASYQRTSTPAKLAELVLGCLRLRFPSTYRHDEVGIVALNADHWFQNVNEFGLTSAAQRQLASLGMPPITLEDGPGGLVTRARPAPTQLPNELALGATFDPAVASMYGTVLGTQASQMGYDGVQAPALNLVRVPSWGRAQESFGESPVLAGELGASEALAIEARHVMVVLKHFGPYSQETGRRGLNQVVSERTYQELYIRPFSFVLRALLPLLDAGDHAVGIMCSYGNVNSTKACRSPELADELGSIGVSALVRSDLAVEVSPIALLESGVDLIKPVDTAELEAGLSQPAVDGALDQAVLQVFATLFADGLVDGLVTAPRPHALSQRNSLVGHLDATKIEERAAVLLKDDGILPLAHAPGRIAVLGDVHVQSTCRGLASSLGRALAEPSTCTDPHLHLQQYVLFHNEPAALLGATRTATFVAPSSGPYVASLTTYGNTTLALDGNAIVTTGGLADFKVQRTALVTLAKGRSYSFDVTWRGAPPIVWLVREQPEVDAMLAGARGARVAIVIAYDLSREGMDRSSLDLPNAQAASISAVAAKVPTIVVLASDGAVTMPWLHKVRGVLEVWNPTGMGQTDATLASYVSAWTTLLDGHVDPSGRLPVTFPVSAQQSPMAVPAFWPGIGDTVDLDLAADGGLGIGEDWYRQEGWPVLFPFGFGLSYTTYRLEGGALTSSAAGLQLSVSVRDTGRVSGIEPLQVYADWPTVLDEPRTQLVGFGTVDFTKADAAAGAVERVAITLSPDALSVFQGGTMRIVGGAYCLEASSYDGDPRSWSTGAITLAPGAGGGVVGPPLTRLTAASCPGGSSAP